SRVRLGSLIEIESALAGGHFMDSIRVESEWRGKQVKGLLRVPVGMISGNEPFVAPPELDARPLDRGVRSFVRKFLVGPGGDPTTGEGELRNPEVPLN